MDIRRREYVPGPPCETLVVSSFARSGILGVGWGFIEGCNSASKKAGAGFSQKAMHVARTTATNGVGFGMLSGLFMGTICGLQDIRQKDDLLNPAMAGGLAGMVLVFRNGPARSYQIFGGGLIGAALMSGIFHFFGKDYSRPEDSD